MSNYNATMSEATVVDGVEVTVTVEDVGGGECKSDHVLLDLQERLGIIQTAYEQETPPSELGDIPDEYLPMMTVAWDRLFSDEENE